jgi:16S rRNA processing protein RimM
MTSTQNVPEDRIQIGQLRSAYGLNGWLWVYSNTEPMSNMFDYLLGTLRPRQVGKP